MIVGNESELEISKILGIDVCDITHEEDCFNIKSNKPNKIKIYKIDFKKLDKYSLKFEDCVFDCEITIVSPSNLSFRNCDFIEKVNIKTNSSFDNTIDISVCNFQKDFIFSKSSCDKTQKTKINFALDGNNIYGKLKISDLEFSGSIEITKNIFHKNIKMSNLVFLKSADLTKNIFNKIDLNKVDFKNGIKFTYSRFKQKTFFGNVSFEKYLDLSSSVFEEELRFCLEIPEQTKIDFSDTKFQRMVSFDKIIFKENVNFSETIFEDSLKFNDVIFEKNLIFSNEDERTIDAKIDMRKTIVNGDFICGGINFNNSIYFRDSIFKNIVNFKDCKFNKVIFSNTTFEDNAYFNNSKFENFADFHESEFEGSACFYGVEFYKTPNFSSVFFAKNAVLINTSFRSNKFDSIKKDCHDEAEFRFKILCQKNKKIEQKEIYKKVYSDFRNSFATLKHILNDSGNLIDASNHHKAELYCKEMELEHSLIKKNYSQTCQDNKSDKKEKDDRKEKNIILFFKSILSILKYIIRFLFNLIFKTVISIEVIFLLPIFLLSYIFCALVLAINDIVKYLFSTNQCAFKRKICIEFNKINRKKIVDFTQWFDYLTLRIYRNTSDHHTNLNKILHFTLLMIACYGLCLFCIYKINYSIIDSGIPSGYQLYFVLNMLSIISLLFILNYKKMSLLSIRAIVFLCFIFFATALLFQNISHIIFGVLAYIQILLILYCIFTKKGSIPIVFTKSFTYIVLLLVLLFSPELINPTLNIFNKENMENRNLLEKLSKLDYEILANLTKLSFGNYSLTINPTFSESTIINQKELIIANKDTLESVLGFLFKRNEKEEIDRILQKLDNKNDLNIILREPKNRSIALDLIYTANKFMKRDFYDMEFNDEFRLKFGLADEKEIQKEIDLVIDTLMKIENILQKLAPVVEKQKNYLDIYNAIRLDKINSQTYKSTYILYVIIMILCLYSLTKTARKNSVIS